MLTPNRILAATVLLLIATPIAEGATYTAETFWLENESSATLDAGFNFGLRFASIERVTLEVRSLESSVNGYCGSSCRFWTLGAKVVPKGDESLFSTQPQLPEFDGPFDYAGDLYVHHFQHLRVWPDYLMQGHVLRPVELPEDWDGGLITIDDTRLKQLLWPDFLLGGEGEIHLASVASWDCGLNCGEVVSRVGVSRPLGISELRIIVEGVAAPEPTMVSFLIGTLALAGCRRRATRAVLVRCTGDLRTL